MEITIKNSTVQPAKYGSHRQPVDDNRQKGWDTEQRDDRLIRGGVLGHGSLTKMCAQIIKAPDPLSINECLRRCRYIVLSFELTDFIETG